MPSITTSCMASASEKVKEKLDELKTQIGWSRWATSTGVERASQIAKPSTQYYLKNDNGKRRQPYSVESSQHFLISIKSSKTNPPNYRPISLTSVTCKVMENIIKDGIMNHMISHELFCDAQHGFVPGRSCISRLLVTTELWTRSLDENTPVATAYLDFINIAYNMHEQCVAEST